MNNNFLAEKITLYTGNSINNYFVLKNKLINKKA